MGEEGPIRNLRIGVNLAHAKGNEKALGPLEVGSGRAREGERWRESYKMGRQRND